MIQQHKESRFKQAITLLQRKQYGCLSKIFCCKCMHCCQDFDFSLLTSEKRKKAFQRMVKRYIRSLQADKDVNVIMDPFFILLALLLGEQSQTYTQLMGIVNNQSQSTIFSKQDLQFYIPQLCTYLVFHQEMKNIQLQNLLERACKVDIHFSLKYYFYMKSLEVINVDNYEIRKYEKVHKYNQQFRTKINNYYKIQKNQREVGTPFNGVPKTPRKISEANEITKPEEQDEKENRIHSKQLGEILSKMKAQDKIKAQDKLKTEEKQNSPSSQYNNRSPTHLCDKFKNNKLKILKQTNIYEPFISQSESYPKGLFESTANFFSDLVQLSKLLLSSSNRKDDLSSYLRNINKRLPATVYIPFTKNCYQDMNVVSIVYEECRVFSTKERAPYYICLQSFFNPKNNERISKDKKIRSVNNTAGNKSTGFPNSNKLKRSQLFEQDCPVELEEINQSSIRVEVEMSVTENHEEEEIRSSTSSSLSAVTSSKEGKEFKPLNKKRKSWASYFKLSNTKHDHLHEKSQFTDENPQLEEEVESKIGQVEKQKQKTIRFLSNEEEQANLRNIFGETEPQQFRRIAELSPYSKLEGYKLLHIIVKSFDDLRQENFAMQLLQEFDRIFKMEKLEVRLLPYEVLPLSHDSGIIECMKDAITIDELRKKGGNLNFVLRDKQKIKNFIHTLAGYSLVTYLLQVKDRHNGNIMIKKDGSIFHIDYGFFMSNIPGKGVQLEKKLPFKLTNEYINAMGGPKSKYFIEFRRLFYQAYNASRKHQHRILILTKLMYSSYGNSMPCFSKGNEAIQKLQERFNPPGISTDLEMSLYCQNLVNSSMDNWRSRWYDKWQYYMQGILY